MYILLEQVYQVDINQQEEEHLFHQVEIKRFLIMFMLPFLRTVCAKSEKGGECVTNIGPSGSGHYVKMVS